MFRALIAATVVGLAAAQRDCSLGANCKMCRAISGCGWCVDTTVPATIDWTKGSCERGGLNGPEDRASKCALSSTNGWNWLACCSEHTGNCEKCVAADSGACGHCVRDSSGGLEPCLEREYNQYRRSFTSSHSERGNCQQSGSSSFYDTTTDECGASTSSRYAALILGTLLVCCCCFCLVCFPCCVLCTALTIGSWRSFCGCICAPHSGGRDDSLEDSGVEGYELRELRGLPAAVLVSGPEAARGSVPRVRAGHFRQANSARSSTSLPVATVHAVELDADAHPVARWGGGSRDGHAPGANVATDLPLATAVEDPSSSSEHLPTATVVIAGRAN